MSGNLPENMTKFNMVVGVGEFGFDTAKDVLLDGQGDLVSLRHQSAQVLAVLVTSRGKVVLKDALVNAVWPNSFVTDDSLVQCIKDIRKVLGDRNHTIVKTIKGKGYLLAIPKQADPQLPTIPSIFVERNLTNINSIEAQLFADEFHDKLVLVMSPRTGVRVFTNETVRETADYLVQYRVSLSGNRTNLFVSLSESRLRGHFYSESFESELGGFKQLAARVAKKVSSVLRISIISHDGLKYINTPDDQLEIDQLLSKAHYFYSFVTTKDTARGRDAMQVAVDREPDNPKALAMLAHSATQMYPLVIADLADGEKKWALSLADRAVVNGASSSFAFRTRGNLRLWLQGDHKGCVADCQRSLKLNPNFYLTHLTLATSEILSGRSIEGEKRLNSFVRLTEIDIQYPLFLSLIAVGRILRGENETAFEAAKEAYERMPKTPWYALVYAAAVGDLLPISGTQSFSKMVSELTLPLSYFRRLPFTSNEDLDLLEGRLKAAGVET